MTSIEEAKPLNLKQAWLPEPEQGFQPGEVKVGWEPEGFRMQARLTDRDVFNPETGFNQPFFRKGDVLELFVQPPDSEAYWEFHIGPDAQRYQVRFPSREAFETVRSVGIPKAWMIQTPSIEAACNFSDQQWDIEAFLPITTLELPEIRPKEAWRMSFCRYDYNRKPKKLFLSSTCPLTACDFHRNFEWTGFMIH